MDSTWKQSLAEEFQKPYFKQLSEFLKQERAERTVYPPAGQVLSAFQIPFDKVRVVILGQDPYHGPGQAHGLSFSVKPGVEPPPSLKNIYKELQSDLGCVPPNHGYLLHWAEQGVFLLNSVLTVQANKAASHQDKGWENFTIRAIKNLSDRGHVVFILWGKLARDKAWVIDREKNAIIESPHPSPFSAATGFFGSKPFSQANAYLKAWGLPEINWQLPQL